jgi:hypothetical protein
MLEERFSESIKPAIADVVSRANKKAPACAGAFCLE